VRVNTESVQWLSVCIVYYCVMKWSGTESQETPVSASGMLGNGSHASSLQSVPDMARPVSSRSQDDAMVAYIFQRPQSDATFQTFAKQNSRWLGDESIIEVKQGHVTEDGPTTVAPSTVNSQPRSQFEQVRAAIYRPLTTVLFIR